MGNGSELEREFKRLSDTIGNEIAKKIALAEALLDEAADLSDFNGIPFKYRFITEERIYIPSSYKRKFFKIHSKKLEEMSKITDIDIENSHDDGEQWIVSDC